MSPFVDRNRYFQDIFDRKDLAIMGRTTNHLPSDPRIKAALRQAIEDELFHEYAPPGGIAELQDLIRDDLGVKGAAVWIINGATEALGQVSQILLEPGQEFLTTDPGYPVASAFARRRGATVVEVPIYDSACEYRVSASRLARAVTKRTRVLYMVDPNNPLGSCLRRDEVKEVADVARDAGAYLVQDCTYRDFSDKQTPAYEFYPERTLCIVSFSKGCGLAGLRVGAVVAHPELIERMTSPQSNHLGANVLSQIAAIAALKTKAEWFPPMFRLQREHQAIIKNAVEAIRGVKVLVYPSQTNFLAVDVSASGYHPAFLASELLDRGVQVRHGGYNSPTCGDKFFRVGSSVPRAWVDRFVS
ncbi:MAG TPA: pyridoxal phosphate-dependent aminotransferase, partial [Candidatus Sulfotelmatobacter sp.]|nr:pyridoxal phosphate-dependent aminotransferase [Candidatus Sulfotelmatobacter sp.]